MHSMMSVRVLKHYGHLTTAMGQSDTCVCSVEAGDAKKARSLVSDDASAAATSAKDCEQTPAVTA